LENDNDFFLAGTTVNMMFEAVTASSGSTATHYFAVRFKHQCVTSSITPAQFFQSSIDLELYTQQVLYFTYPSSSLNCGTFSFSLIDPVTGVAVPASTYALDLSSPVVGKVTVLYTNSQQLLNSPYQLAVKAKLGSFATSISSPITINLLDPCLNTNFMTQNIVNMTSTLNAQAPSTQTYQLFKDTVSQAESVQYGNGLGFGICGP
jgi:hypothetical protein